MFTMMTFILELDVSLLGSAEHRTLIMRWNYSFLSQGGMEICYIHPIMGKGHPV